MCTFKGRFPIVSIILAQKHQANINYRPIFEKKECFFGRDACCFLFRHNLNINRCSHSVHGKFAKKD